MLAATDLEPARSVADDYLATVRASRGGTSAGHTHVPPVTVPATGSGALFEWLHASGLLPGVLLRAQLLLREHLAVALRVIPDPEPDPLDVVLAGAGGATPAHAIAVRRAISRAGRSRTTCAGWRSARARSTRRPGATSSRCPQPRRALGTDPTLSSFCAQRHIDKAETAPPLVGSGRSRSLAFVTRAPCPGADDDRALQVSAALHAHEPAAALHLLVIGAGGIRAPATAIGPLRHDHDAVGRGGRAGARRAHAGGRGGRVPRRRRRRARDAGARRGAARRRARRRRARAGGGRRGPAARRPPGPVRRRRAAARAPRRHGGEDRVRAR